MSNLEITLGHEAWQWNNYTNFEFVKHDVTVKGIARLSIPPERQAHLTRAEADGWERHQVHESGLLDSDDAQPLVIVADGREVYAGSVTGAKLETHAGDDELVITFEAKRVADA